MNIIPTNTTSFEEIVNNLIKDIKITGLENIIKIISSSESLLSNNQMFNNGDNIHFCKDSLKELGKRYYQAFDKIMKK